MIDSSTRYTIEDLLYLMQRLRKPVTGCPWDLVQTYRTIGPSTIEEAYEVVDAIEREDYRDLQEELGDLLFQVVFYSQIATEEDRFNFDQVVSDLVGKLIRRHPHVFPDGTLSSEKSVVNLAAESQVAQVKSRWEAQKQEERAGKGKHGLLDDVPVTLPATSRALKLQKRASSVGFDWTELEGVFAKLTEELDEVREAIADQNPDQVEEELGDLLFMVINLARHQKVDPEKALRRANRKFEQRFGYIESSLAEQGLSPTQATPAQMDDLWNEAKSALKVSVP